MGSRLGAQVVTCKYAVFQRGTNILIHGGHFIMMRGFSPPRAIIVGRLDGKRQE